MTRSYEAQTKAIWNTDQTLPSRWLFRFLLCSSQTCCYFGGYFPHSPCCQGCICATAPSAPRLSPAPAQHHNVCCEGLQGLPVFQAQGTSVAPGATSAPATDKFREQSLCLSLGLQSRLVSQAGRSSAASERRLPAGARREGAERS